jgi:hypothetical protein
MAKPTTTYRYVITTTDPERAQRWEALALNHASMAATIKALLDAAASKPRRTTQSGTASQTDRIPPVPGAEPPR